MSRLVFLSGLPRSGSTLLANVLALHPQVTTTPTSPLYPIVESLRSAWSEEETFLAQLDADFDRCYERLARALCAFMESWSEADTAVSVDKHRGWLQAVETLRHLDPDFRMIVCLRDLRDIYASIESQHRRTLLLTFPGRLEQNLVDVRAQQLFSPGGQIGGPLRALFNLADVPEIRENLFFWRYEEFLDRPQDVLGQLVTWLGLDSASFDLEAIPQTTAEADSYYHFKFPHRVGSSLRRSPVADERAVSRRILESIVQRFGWYYRQFYRKDGVVRFESDPDAVLSDLEETGRM